jgi:hypothetical protein
MKDDRMSTVEHADPALSRSSEPADVYEGIYFFRLNGGPEVAITAHIEISRERILIRYGDGLTHIGRRGDDAVEFFVNALGPSLRQPAFASRRSPGPEGFPARP